MQITDRKVKSWKKGKSAIAGTASGEGVFLLHGHGRTGLSMQFMARALGQKGYGTLAPSYGFRRSLARILQAIESEFTDFSKRYAKVHIVTHSLGGLVARALIAKHRPDNLGKVVMLGPPNSGSELADFLGDLRISGAVLGPISSYLCTSRLEEDEALLGSVTYPLGIIAGTRSLTPMAGRFLPTPNDGMVSVASTRLPGMQDHMTISVPHTILPMHPQVIAQVQAFLETGAFRGHRQGRAASSVSRSKAPSRAS